MGKISKLKEEYLSYRDNLAKLSENKSIVAKLEELEGYKSDIDSMTQENTKFSEELENQELNLKDLTTALTDREKRFKDLYDEGINFVFQKS